MMQKRTVPGPCSGLPAAAPAFPLAAGGVGIIGGADGPTAVFVTTTMPAWVCLLLGAALLAGAAGLFLWVRELLKSRRHRRDQDR